MSHRRREQFFARFKQHTKLKLDVLETYFAAWASILLLRDDRIWFVDGFAGKGKDDQGNPGSPLRAARLAEKIQREYAATGKAKEIRVVAVEASRRRFSALRNNLDAFTGPDGVAEVRHGDAWSGIADVVSRAKSEPILAFVDPFGVKGLSATNLAALLAARKHEALILFNDVGAVRLHGAATAQRKGKAMKGADMFGPINPESATGVDPELADSPAALQLPSREILEAAFGAMYPSVAEELSRTPLRDRRRLMMEKYLDCLKAESGALYVTGMPIESEGKHHYWLIHASKSDVAKVTMKTAMAKALREHERDANSMFAGMSFATDGDINSIAAKILERFAGQQVRWENRADRRTGVWFYALAETDARPADKEEIRSRLAEFIVSARPLEYEFPPLAGA